MRSSSIKAFFRRNGRAYLFIAPFFIVYLCFHLYPQLFSLYLSVTDFKIRGGTVFVGLRQFQRAFADPMFWKALSNTAIFWITTLPVQMLAAIVIASVMANLPSRLRGVLSGCYYLPVVTNLVAVIFIFQLMFDEQFGVLNYVLSAMGLGSVPWLTDPIVAKLSTVLLITWKGLGYYVVYTLAGLMSVDRSLYEFAIIEGASPVGKTVYITLPSIAPVLLYQAFTGTIAGFNIFLEPFLLFNKGNNGLFGPLNSALTSSIYIYNAGFSNLKFSYGAAMSVILALITMVFAVLQFRLFRQDRDVARG